MELCKRILVYHLADGSTIESIYIRVPFAEAVRELLEDKHFGQFGAGNVINLSQVTMVGNEEITFKDSISAFFSKKICNEVRSAWMEQ